MGEYSIARWVEGPFRVGRPIAYRMPRGGCLADYEFGQLACAEGRRQLLNRRIEFSGSPRCRAGDCSAAAVIELPGQTMAGLVAGRVHGESADSTGESSEIIRTAMGLALVTSSVVSGEGLGTCRDHGRVAARDGVTNAVCPSSDPACGWSRVEDSPTGLPFATRRRMLLAAMPPGASS